MLCWRSLSRWVMLQYVFRSNDYLIGSLIFKIVEIWKFRSN
jgi:hypothetical protein